MFIFLFFSILEMLLFVGLFKIVDRLGIFFVLLFGLFFLGGVFLFILVNMLFRLGVLLLFSNMLLRLRFFVGGCGWGGLGWVGGWGLGCGVGGCGCGLGFDGMMFGLIIGCLLNWLLDGGCWFLLFMFGFTFGFGFMLLLLGNCCWF